MNSSCGTIGLAGDEDSDPAVTDSYELVISHYLSENTSLVLNLFYNDSEVSVFSNSLGAFVNGAEIETAGLELELKYQTEKLDLIASHSYVRLLNIRYLDSSIDDISAEPFGYGNGLYDYSDHVSKLYANYKFTPKFNAYTSLILLWGFPGSEDFADRDEDLGSHNGVTITGDADDDAFSASIFLNMGCKYSFTDAFIAEVNLHNVLGWVDEVYNKETIYRTSNYRVRAPAVSVGVTYSF